MRRFINLDTGLVTERLTFSLPKDIAKFSRGEQQVCELKFHRAGTAELLGDGSTLRLSFKAEGVFDGSVIATLTAFTAPDDADGYYTGTIDFNTNEADTLLARNSATTDDVESAPLVGQIRWVDGVTSVPGKSQNFYAELWNDVIRGDESSTTASAGGQAWVNLPTITALTGGTAAALDALITADGRYPAGTLLALNVVGEPMLWRVQRCAIVSSTAANPSTITTSTPHGLTTGQTPAIGGHSTAAINSAAVAVTVLTNTTFTVAALGGGTGGYVTPAESTDLGFVRPDDFAAATGYHFTSAI